MKFKIMKFNQAINSALILVSTALTSSSATEGFCKALKKPNDYNDMKCDKFGPFKGSGFATPVVANAATEIKPANPVFKADTKNVSPSASPVAPELHSIRVVALRAFLPPIKEVWTDASIMEKYTHFLMHLKRIQNDNPKFKKSILKAIFSSPDAFKYDSVTSNVYTQLQNAIRSKHVTGKKKEIPKQIYYKFMKAADAESAVLAARTTSFATLVPAHLDEAHLKTLLSKISKRVSENRVSKSGNDLMIHEQIDENLKPIYDGYRILSSYFENPASPDLKELLLENSPKSALEQTGLRGSADAKAVLNVSHKPGATLIDRKKLKALLSKIYALHSMPTQLKDKFESFNKSVHELDFAMDNLPKQAQQ
jgi:hypothetical protein